MQYDWIFDVLRDLRAYALANGLPALAAKADEALITARAEIAARRSGDDGGAPPPGGTCH
jgi:hypothetical protein